VSGDWRDSVNVGALSAESRRAVLEAVRGKLGETGAARGGVFEVEGELPLLLGAFHVLAGPLSLSLEEQRFVLSAQVGQGLLKSPLGHVPFRNMRSRGELERFITRPEEVSRRLFSPPSGVRLALC
jgi:hypothetical protein